MRLAVPQLALHTEMSSPLLPLARRGGQGGAAKACCAHLGLHAKNVIPTRATAPAVTRRRDLLLLQLQRAAPSLQPRQYDAPLRLIFPFLVFVTDLAGLIRLEEQHLAQSLIGINLRRQWRGVADL